MDQQLEHLLSESERPFVGSQLAAFDQPDSNRGQLAKSANMSEMFVLEKRIVPQLNAERIPTPDPDVLVCTVGFRPHPVILTALILKPRKLYLYHSTDSRPYAETIRDDPDIQALGLAPNRDVVLREISLTDAPSNYGQLRQDVTENKGQQIVVDVSGGVKVMGVSVAAAAFWLRLPVIYLMGDEVQGIIRPFSERLNLLQNPYDHFGDTEFQVLAELFDAGDYDAALSTCMALRDQVGDVATLGKLDILQELIVLYRDWDAFSHSILEDHILRKLATRLRVIDGKMKRLGLQLVDPGAIADNEAFLKELEATWQEGRRNQSDRYRLIDIYCAAERRARAGKYDDATARLYRCLEMSATIVLLRDWQLSSIRNPDFGALAASLEGAASLHEAFQQQAGYPLPHRIGLDAQMALLRVGGRHRAITGIHKGMTKGNPSLMEGRNRSTLAHGTVPVSKDVYQQFSTKTAAIIRHVVGKSAFQRLVRQATHPKLRM